MNWHFFFIKHFSFSELVKQTKRHNIFSGTIHCRVFADWWTWPQRGLRLSWWNAHRIKKISPHLLSVYDGYINWLKYILYYQLLCFLTSSFHVCVSEDNHWRNHTSMEIYVRMFIIMNVKQHSETIISNCENTINYCLLVIISV